MANEHYMDNDPDFYIFLFYYDFDVSLKNGLKFARTCLRRSDASASISPQVNTIDIESVTEPHTDITIPQAVYTPPPPTHQLNLYFFK